jgi:hypothetical protein
MGPFSVWSLGSGVTFWATTRDKPGLRDGDDVGRTLGSGLDGVEAFGLAGEFIETVENRQQELDQEISVLERPFIEALERFEARADAEGIDLHGSESSDS